MIIKQSVINTFKRCGIKYQDYDSDTKTIPVANRFSGDTCLVSPLVAHLIDWVYSTSNDYETGKRDIRIDDFDRIRYFILEADKEAYYTCID